MLDCVRGVLPPLESIMCWLRASLAVFIDSLIVIDENPGNVWILGSRLGKADDFLEAFPKSCRKLTIPGMVCDYLQLWIYEGFCRIGVCPIALVFL